MMILRKAFFTFLHKAGVATRVVQEAMRHSDPKLTTNNYTDVNQSNMSEAINRLPNFGTSKKEAVAPVFNSQSLTLTVNSKNDSKNLQVLSIEGDCHSLTSSDKLSRVWKLYLKTPTRPDSVPETLKRYGQYFSRFKQWLTVNYPAIQELGNVTEDIAIQYADFVWEQGVSGKTFNTHMQAIKLIVNHLQKKAGLDENPFHSIGRKIENKLSRKEFSEIQVLEILNSFNDPKLILNDKEEMEVLFNFGAWTGLRLIDCVLMKWENINLERNIIFCVPHKTQRVKRTVNVPIYPLLRDNSIKL